MISALVLEEECSVNSHFVICTIVCFLSGMIDLKSISINERNLFKNQNISGHINAHLVTTSLDYDDVISGTTIISELENEDVDDLYISNKSANLYASISNNLDGTFSASFVTPGIEGDYYATFDSHTSPSEGEGISSIFIHSDGIYDSISTASFDDARSKYYINHVASDDDLVILGINETPESFSTSKTRYEVETNYSDIVFNGNDIVTNTVVRSIDLSNQIRVKGTAYWYDELNQPHPLRGTHLQLYDYDSFLYSDFLGGANTDDNGSFCFMVSEQTFLEIGGRDLYITLFPRNRSCNVHGEVWQYAYSTPTYSNVQKNHEIEYTINIYPGLSDRANAFEICQAQLSPHDYIYELSGTNLPSINIVYPSIVSGSCYYFRLLNYIAVGKDYYRDWDCLNHEYGHYICDTFSLCNPSWFAYHRAGWDLIEHMGKENGLKFAMFEGLASYFGTAAQMYYGTASNIPRVGDESYNSVNQLVADYGSWRYGDYVNHHFGEGNECSVTSLLIKLLDDDERYGLDNVAIGHQGMWNIISSSQHLYVSSLVCDIISAYPSLKNAIGVLLEQERFSSQLFYQSSSLSTNPNNSCWTFDWTSGSTSSGKSNRFNLVFQSVNSTYQISNIQPASSINSSYTLTQEQMNGVLALPGDTISCYVVGYHTGIPLTGGYPSAFKTINKPPYTQMSSVSGIAYSSYIASGETKWYKFTAPETNTYYFESSGLVDTYGEVFSAMVVDGSTSGLLEYDDDSGSNYNFKISIVLDADQTIFLRVCGYSSNDYGNYSVNVTYTHIHSFNSSYSQYSSTQHKAYCNCGNYTLSMHVADGSHIYSYLGHLYARCLYCNYAIDLGGNGPITPIQSSGYSQMVTDNGSYILPNGIYVIMEEDLDSFFNGTLIFHPVDEITV